ncbi:MAG: TonB-dependent receptor [Hyphomonadaceae bacterium]|nr:TonB-dependent receptor [Hyphomonadaceae bacterium]
MLMPAGKRAGPSLRLQPSLCALLISVAAPSAWSQQTPASVEQISPKADESNSNITPYQPAFFTEFRPNTAFDMVVRIPGFVFENSGFARGFAGTAGNVLIDAERPPSRNDTLSSVLSRIPASAVERIDIIRGGAEGIDMRGKPIIANVIRKPDAGATGAVNANTNLNTRGGGSVSANIQMQDQRDGRRLEGSLGGNGGLAKGENSRQRIAPSGVTILDAYSESDNDYENYFATGAYESALLGGKVRINGQANFSIAQYASEEVQTIPLAGSQVEHYEDESASGEIGLRYTRDIAGYGVELVAFQSLESEESTNLFNTSTFTSGGQSTGNSGQSIARATVRLPTADKLSFETGAEGVYNWTESESANIFNGQVFPLPGDAFQADETRAEAFAAVTWKPSETLNVELGARYEWSHIAADLGADSSEKTLGYLKPRLNVSWSPEKDHQFNLRVERTVDQLSFEGFASSVSFENGVFGIGNVEIEPEKSWIVEGRYERQFGGQNSFVAKLTHREIENVLGNVAGPAPDFFQFSRNGGSATFDTLTLSGIVELDRFGMPGGILNLGGNVQSTETLDPVTGESRRVSQESTYGWNLSLQQTLDNGNFRWSLFVEDDDDYYNYSVRSFGKSAQLMFIGGNISWKPVAGWTFGAGINNILRSGGRGWSVFYNAPRNVGTPLYLSRGGGDGVTTFFVSLRRNF